MQIKDLGYEITGLPAIERVRITESVGPDGPYVETIIKIEGKQHPISFDLSGLRELAFGLADALRLADSLDDKIIEQEGPAPS